MKKCSISNGFSCPISSAINGDCKVMLALAKLMQAIKECEQGKKKDGLERDTHKT
jgi:hypothetical protein